MAPSSLTRSRSFSSGQASVSITSETRKSTGSLTAVETEDFTRGATATTPLGDLSGGSEAKRGRYDKDFEEMAEVCDHDPGLREKLLEVFRRLRKDQGDDEGSMA